MSRAWYIGTMTLQEAIVAMVQKPYLIALSPQGRVIGFNPAGYLVDFAKGGKVYPRLRMQDFLQDSWELKTPDELEALAQAGKQAG